MEESPKRFTRGDAKRQAEFENVDKQNEAEDDEDVKSISSDDVIVETKKKGRKSKGKKEGKKMKKAEEETQVESDEDVLYEGNNSDDERLPVAKAKKKQKMRKKAESSSSRSYLIKQSKNDIEEGENNQSEGFTRQSETTFSFKRRSHPQLPLIPTFIASSLLTCPSAPLVVSSIGICRTPTITGQMANSVALVAFGSTWTIMMIVAFRTQWLRSP
ncbi:hypothetical protein Tco_0558367 [Tanacetum coccineum]